MARIGTRPKKVATWRVARSAAFSSTSVSRGRCSSGPGREPGNAHRRLCATSVPVLAVGRVVTHFAFAPLAAIQMAKNIRCRAR